MKGLGELLHNWKVILFEKRMKKMKPQLINRWYSSLEEQIRKEYEEELDKRGDQIYRLNQELKSLRNSRDYFKGKYEGVVEMQDKVQDKLINKIEQSGTVKGQLRQEVKQLKEEVATMEASDSLVDTEG